MGVMTDDEIEEIRARWAAVPEGPWELDRTGLLGAVRTADGRKVSGVEDIITVDTYFDSVFAEFNERAKAALEHAPDDIAALLAEIDRVRRYSPPPQPAKGEW
jgi:hypothetical protein